MSDKYTDWRKSRRSEPGAECVEVAKGTDRSVGVRDSKTGNGSPILEFSRSDWAAFVNRLRQD